MANVKDQYLKHADKLKTNRTCGSFKAGAHVMWVELPKNINSFKMQAVA